MRGIYVYICILFLYYPLNLPLPFVARVECTARSVVLCTYIKVRLCLVFTYPYIIYMVLVLCDVFFFARVCRETPVRRTAIARRRASNNIHICETVLRRKEI